MTLRGLDGPLRFFGYSGGFGPERIAAIDAPVAVDVDDLCSVDESCSDSSVRLTANVTSDSDSVSLAGQQRGVLELEGKTCQALNYVATRFGVAAGNAHTVTPPAPRGSDGSYFLEPKEQMLGKE